MPMQKAKVTTSAASSSAGRSSGGGAERPTGRNIIVCCDGTGITEDHMTGQSVTPSNILKIFNCIDVSGDDNGDSEREQVAFYEKGVATTGNVLTRASTGGTRDATAKAIFHKILHIGTGCDYEVEISGYLHVYANDN